MGLEAGLLRAMGIFYKLGKRETWLVARWVDDSADAPGSVNVADATHTNPSGIRDRVGAAEAVIKI